jgi:N-acylneuraminate cytidylyltransferase
MRSCILVPIKTNNKRLPGKTFKDLNGKPLWSYLFSTLGKTEIDTYVDSSSESVLEIATELGFTSIKRPIKYNLDHITGDELIARDLNLLSSYDVIGLLHITSPFLKVETIKKAISTLEENPDLDSLFGAVSRQGRFWYNGEPVNHDPQKLQICISLEENHSKNMAREFVEIFKLWK